MYFCTFIPKNSQNIFLAFLICLTKSAKIWLQLTTFFTDFCLLHRHFVIARHLCRGVYSFCLSVRPFVRSYVRSFVCAPVTFVEFYLRESFSSGVYLTNHSSEIIHIWTIGILEVRLSFHDSDPRFHVRGWE